MEKLFNAFKEVLLNNFNDNLEKYSDEKIKLDEIKENSIYFGAIDLIKTQSNLLISFYPESRQESEVTIDGEEVEENIVQCAIVCRGDKYENLMIKLCRYTECFKDTLAENYDFNGNCENVEIKTESYYPDAGITEKSVVAVELEMTIYKKTNYFE